MPDVRCSVSNCFYWGKENYCQASSILVQPDTQLFSEPGKSDSFENSILSGEEMESTASTSIETCCKTFRHA